jgi:hypothetical protein
MFKRGIIMASLAEKTGISTIFLFVLIGKGL